jgi:tetratricopeptide (TPR) repeat protein
MDLYHHGLYRQAATRLGQAGVGTDMQGTVARYYEAMANRAAGLEALREGRFDEAEGLLRAAADAIGRNGDLAGYLASLYAHKRDFRRCERETHKAVEISGEESFAWKRNSLAQWRCGQHEQAHLTIHEALRHFGDDLQLHLQQGLFYSVEGDYVRAKNCFQMALAADCSCAQAHYYLALCHSACGDTLAALKSFQQAFELQPDNLMIAYELSLSARAAAQAGHQFVIRLKDITSPPAEGSHMRQLANYITAEGDFVDSLLTLPCGETDAEMFGMLAGVLKMALDEHPRYADLHYHAAGVFQRLGQTDKAIEHARAAIAINEQYVKARLLLGRLCADVGRNAEALENIEAAIAAGGDWADVHCLAGELKIKAGRVQDARYNLERAIQINGKYWRAAETLFAIAA